MQVAVHVVIAAEIVPPTATSGPAHVTLREAPQEAPREPTAADRGGRSDGRLVDQGRRHHLIVGHQRDVVAGNVRVGEA